MSSKEVVIESMWSPAVALLVSQGVPVKFAAPPSGYRGWVGNQAIATHVTGAKLDAVYDYINWTNEGFLGALIMRQGYYVANGKTLPAWLKSPRAKTGKPPFTMAEYDFWYNGKPAATDLPGITGHVGDVKKGQVRDGGSFLQRSKHYSTWNSYFKENVYQVKRFNDFLSS
jgi:putative spermidine/putrescine transport system substrate-binding protein